MQSVGNKGLFHCSQNLRMWRTAQTLSVSFAIGLRKNWTLQRVHTVKSDHNDRLEVSTIIAVNSLNRVWIIIRIIIGSYTFSFQLVIVFQGTHGCGHVLLSGLDSWTLTAELIWQLCEQSRTIASFYSNLKLDPHTSLGDMSGKPQHPYQILQSGYQCICLKRFSCFHH